MSWHLDESDQVTPLAGGGAIRTARRRVVFSADQRMADVSFERRGGDLPPTAEVILDHIKAAVVSVAEETEIGHRTAALAEQHDAAAKQARLAQAELAELVAKRERAELSAAPGLADTLLDIDKQRAEAQARLDSFAAKVRVLDDSIATFKPALEAAKRAAVYTAAAQAAEALRERRAELLRQLEAVAGPILDELLAVDMALPQVEQRERVAALAADLVPDTRPKKWDPAKREMVPA